MHISPSLTFGSVRFGEWQQVTVTNSGVDFHNPSYVNEGDTLEVNPAQTNALDELAIRFHHRNNAKPHAREGFTPGPEGYVPEQWLTENTTFTAVG